MSRTRAWISLVIAIVVVATLAAGAVWWIRRTPTALTPAANGDVTGVIDAGGQEQFIDCRGRGAPTVVLVSGRYGWSKDWAGVADRMREFARVCTYDRAGLGSSPPRRGQGRIDSGVHAAELRALLEAAGEPGPWVLVAHSYGGLVARSLLQQSPDRVAGLDLLDAVPTRFADVYPPWGREREEGGAIVDYDRSADATGGTAPLATLPLIVMSAGQPLQAQDPDWARLAWQEAQDDVAAASDDSLRLIADGAQHQLQQYAPDAVVETVRVLEESVRAGTPLPGCPGTWADFGVTCVVE